MQVYVQVHVQVHVSIAPLGFLCDYFLYIFRSLNRLIFFGE